MNFWSRDFFGLSVLEALGMFLGSLTLLPPQMLHFQMADIIQGIVDTEELKITQTS